MTASSGTLGPYLNVNVQEGSSTGTFASCSEFVAGSVAFDGTLTAFAAAATSYTTGIGSFGATGAGQARTYKVTYAVAPDAPDAAQSTTASFTMRWEARNTDFTALRVAGDNASGQLGDGTTTNRVAAPSTSGGSETGWQSISAGDATSCAIKANGTLWCWGLNTAGQLGDNSTTLRSNPTQVGVATDWVKVATSGKHTCGIRADRSLWCWGDNTASALGLGGGDTTNRLVPTKVGTSAWRTVVTSLNSFTCGIRSDGVLLCWGSGANGKLGTSDTTGRDAPAAVTGGFTDWTAISLGVHHACGIRTGRAYCWGFNARGNLGIGITADVTSPTEVTGGSTDWATIVAAGDNLGAHTCATKTDRTLWCWGNNASGQLGQGDLTQRVYPTRSGAATTWSSVSDGVGSTRCGLRENRTLWCWGSNASGEAGTGNTSVLQSPAQVATGIRASATGRLHQLALPWVGP